MQMEGEKIPVFGHRLDESKESKRSKKIVRWLAPRKVCERTADSYSDEPESGTITAKCEQFFLNWCTAGRTR